jgi:hypothetical protein
MEVEIKRILISAGAILLVSGIVAVICIAHFVGFPKTVSDNKTKYTTHEIHVQHDEIDLFGVALAPEGNGPFPTVIYAHGAESDYRSDMTTLKSLAMSGIACYTFDFYGWSTRSSGPQAGNWFKNQPRGVDDRYEKQVIEQVKDLDAVIEKVLLLLPLLILMMTNPMFSPANTRWTLRGRSTALFGRNWLNEASC